MEIDASTLTINISSLPVSAIIGSTYPLFQYTTFSGTLSSYTASGSLSGSSMPAGYTGHLTQAGGAINLVIDTVPAAPVLAVSSATASPAAIIPSGNTSFSVSLVNGTSPYTVTVDYSLLEGQPANTDVQTLTGSGTGPYTGSAVAPLNTLAAGTYSLPVSVTDSTTPIAQTASDTISVTIQYPTWNVTSGNWSASGSWTPSGPPASTDTAVFGATGVSGSSTTVNNTVDAGFSGTITALTYNQTGSTHYHVTQINSPQTLTVSGTITVGGLTGIGTSTATLVYMTGSGGLVANGNINVYNSGTSADTAVLATFNLSALANFIYNNSSGTIAIASSNSPANYESGLMVLAGVSNNVTAGTISVGAPHVSNNGANCSLNLGGGTNIINVGTLNIGMYKDTATVQFNGSTGGLRLRGVNGNSDDTSRAEINIGDVNGAGATSTPKGDLTLTGGLPVDIKADTVLIGRANASSGTPSPIGTLTFDAGTFDATTINMAVDSEGGTATGTINVSNNATEGTSGTLIVGTGGLSLVNQTAGAGTGNLNISGGTVTCNGSITKTTSAGTGSIVFSSGGTLQMASACYVGSASVPIDTFTLDDNATWQFVVPSDGTVNAVVGTLTWPASDSTLTVDISSLPGSAVVGSTYHLIQYTTFSGTFSAPVVNLPVSYTGHLAQNGTPSGTIDLVIDTTPGPGVFTNPPGITSFTLVNVTNVTISGTNGQSGDAYYLLESTNLALPLSQWNSVGTDVLSANGPFTITYTNVVNTNNWQQFYILSNTNN